MLHIYMHKVPEGFNKRRDAEAIFKSLLMQGEKFDDPLSREVMQKIDGVTVKKGLYIVTKFGECSLYQLSTGTKTVLNALHYRDTNTLVPMVEAGPNAISLLMDISRREKLNTNVYIERGMDLPGREDFDCYFDGVRFRSGEKLYATICGWI